MGLRKRDVALAIILSIVTCGIYYLYWYVILIDDVKYTTNDGTLPSGGTALVLTIITCGIYGIYVWYKIGRSLYDSGISRSDNSLVYLIISIFGFGIVNSCIVQSDLNIYCDQDQNQN